MSRTLRLAIAALALLHLCSCGDIADYLTQDFLPPDAPSNLKGTAVSSSQIDLTWNASTDNKEIGHYMVYRNQVHISNPGSTSYSDTGLSPASEFCYMVRAVDTSGNKSDKSPSLCITTLDTGNVDITAPSVPDGLVAIVNSSSKITVAWSNSVDNVIVSGYELHRSLSADGLYSLLSTALVNSYADGGLSNSTLYCYKCLAYDPTGNKSALSNHACATTEP